MSLSILFLSGKGGVGKSTAASSIALALGHRGKSVILMDGDTGLRSVDLMLNMQDRILLDVSDVLSGNCSVADALYPVPGAENVRLLSCSQFMRAAEIKPRDIRSMTDPMREQCDYLLIDCPAGLGRSLKINLTSADTAVMVATPDDGAVRAAERCAQEIQGYGLTHPYLLINRYHAQMVRKKQMTAPERIAEALDMPLLGKIPESYAVYEALLGHRTAYRCSDFAVCDAYGRAAAVLAGESLPPEGKGPGPMARFFRRMLREE